MAVDVLTLENEQISKIKAWHQALVSAWYVHERFSRRSGWVLKGQRKKFESLYTANEVGKQSLDEYIAGYTARVRHGSFWQRLKGRLLGWYRGETAFVSYVKSRRSYEAFRQLLSIDPSKAPSPRVEQAVLGRQEKQQLNALLREAIKSTSCSSLWCDQLFKVSGDRSKWYHWLSRRLFKRWRTRAWAKKSLEPYVFGVRYSEMKRLLEAVKLPDEVPRLAKYNDDVEAYKTAVAQFIQAKVWGHSEAGKTDQAKTAIALLQLQVYGADASEALRCLHDSLKGSELSSEAVQARAKKAMKPWIILLHPDKWREYDKREYDEKVKQASTECFQQLQAAIKGCNTHDLVSCEMSAWFQAEIAALRVEVRQFSEEVTAGNQSLKAELDEAQTKVAQAEERQAQAEERQVQAEERQAQAEEKHTQEKEEMKTALDETKTALDETKTALDKTQTEVSELRALMMAFMANQQQVSSSSTQLSTHPMSLHGVQGLSKESKESEEVASNEPANH